jgi:hypothetical protein
VIEIYIWTKYKSRRFLSETERKKKYDRTLRTPKIYNKKISINFD